VVISHGFKKEKNVSNLCIARERRNKVNCKKKRLLTKLVYDKGNTGTTKLRNENETKRNEMKRNEIQRNETKNEETNRNEMKYHKPKRNTTKRNETK
jgi:hypothetical protein